MSIRPLLGCVWGGGCHSFIYSHLLSTGYETKTLLDAGDTTLDKSPCPRGLHNLAAPTVMELQWEPTVFMLHDTGRMVSLSSSCRWLPGKLPGAYMS